VRRKASSALAALLHISRNTKFERLKLFARKDPIVRRTRQPVMAKPLAPIVPDDPMIAMFALDARPMKFDHTSRSETGS
jgi:hypothetical protein